MALIDTAKSSFSSGELSPKMFLRSDVDRYRNGAGLLENFRVLVQGGLTRREGTRWVAAARFPSRAVVLKAFEPSATDAYILEFGHQYLRFYKNSAQILAAPNTPAIIESPHIPWLDVELRNLRTAQSNDVMIIVHPAHAPRRLSRLSDTEWVCTPVVFDPPPLYEAGVSPLVALTLSATIGTVTATAASPVFLPADAQRQLTSGVGRGIVTAVLSPTAVTLKVLDVFTTTALAAGAWTLEGSPVAEAKPDVKGPEGAQVVVFLQGRQDGMPELVTNGNFVGGASGWVAQGIETLAVGTHDGANDSASLVDSTKNFIGLGVQPGYQVANTTTGGRGTIASVTTTVLILGAPGLTGGTTNEWDAGNVYTVETVGNVTTPGVGVRMSSGGMVAQTISTTAGRSYEVRFTVADAPLSFFVEAGTGGTLLLTEVTYEVGEQRAVFTATGPTAILRFRNTQTAISMLTEVSAKEYTMQGFRATEFPTYMRLSGGLIRVTDIGPTNIIGEIVKELSTDSAVAAGAWSLESPRWSGILGWPSDVWFFEGRLYFGFSPQFPNRIWGSVIDDFFNFALGPNPDDALDFGLVDSGGNVTLNVGVWGMPAENLLIGTTHGEYRLIGAGDDPITPVSLPRNRLQSTYGSAPIKPLKVGGSLLFVQRQGSTIRGMSYDERTQTTYLAQDLMATSDHLFHTFSPLELAYQQEPLSTLWVPRSDGQAVAGTYEQGEQVLAWWRMTTQGSVESVAVIPHPTENSHQVWMVVQRTIGTTFVRYIEFLDPHARMVLPEPVMMTNELTGEQETVTGWDGLTLDCAASYSGPPITHFIGPPLVGAMVSIVGDGAVLPDQLMTDAGIDLPLPVSTCWIGLKYTPRGRCLPVDIPVRGQTGQGLRKRWVHLQARLEKTACLILNNERMPFRQAHMPMNQGVAPFTGDRTVTPLGWDGYGSVSFEVPDPLPCTIIGIVGLLDSEVR